MLVNVQSTSSSVQSGDALHEVKRHPVMKEGVEDDDVMMVHPVTHRSSLARRSSSCASQMTQSK